MPNILNFVFGLNKTSFSFCASDTPNLATFSRSFPALEYILNKTFPLNAIAINLDLLVETNEYSFNTEAFANAEEYLFNSAGVKFELLLISYTDYF